MLQKETEKIQVHNSTNNSNEMLTPKEAELLNFLLEKSRYSFDFHDKKVAFITGSSGNRILTKSDYFESCITPWLDKGEAPQIIMIELTEEEKNKSGGYDALVLSWVKYFTNKQKKKIIEQLARKE
jgi:hypothetical protein